MHKHRVLRSLFWRIPMTYKQRLANLTDGNRKKKSFFCCFGWKTWFEINRFIGEARVRVTLARPRIRPSGGGGGGGGRRYFDSNKRCFQCGERGHFSRDCGTEQRANKKRSNNGYRWVFLKKNGVAQKHNWRDICVCKFVHLIILGISKMVHYWKLFLGFWFSKVIRLRSVCACLFFQQKKNNSIDPY